MDKNWTDVVIIGLVNDNGAKRSQRRSFLITANSWNIMNLLYLMF